MVPAMFALVCCGKGSIAAVDLSGMHKSMGVGRAVSKIVQVVLFPTGVCVSRLRGQGRKMVPSGSFPSGEIS